MARGDGPDDRVGPVRILDRPPGRVFHVALVAGLGLWLWARSVPGLDFPLWAAAALSLGLLGLGWTLRVGTFAWARRRGHATGSPKWFAAAPTAVLLGLALVVLDVPLQARFTASRGAFEALVHRAPPPSTPTDWVDFAVPERVGTYRISNAYRVGDAVILYESTGDFVGDAGFAYLPSGPFDELDTGWFEAPQFRPLGDGWYAWTASW